MLRNKVEVVKQQSLDGENAQISWCKRANGWLIGSRQVTILVYKESQLSGSEFKQKGMQEICLQIAKLWFGIIKPLEEAGFLD